MSRKCRHFLTPSLVLIMIPTTIFSRMQTMLASADVKRPTMFSVIRSSVAEAGFISLYTGLSASLLRQMTYSLVRLGSFASIKNSISADGPPSAANTFLAAMLAGALGGMAGNPAGTRPFYHIALPCLTILSFRCDFGPNDQRSHQTSRAAIWVLQRLYRTGPSGKDRGTHGTCEGSRDKSSKFSIVSFPIVLTLRAYPRPELF